MPGEGKLAAGSVFAGEFEIVEELGEGGMGALYVARQQSTGALRALKLMQRELVRSKDLRDKFEREARIGAQIESDHVAAVLAAGVDVQTGLPWIAMELLRGETLAGRLARGPLPWPEVVSIFTQMCHALAAAHKKGVVHRDLKPENVFLAAPRVAGVEVMVKLLDFGIAKVVAESATDLTGVIGTPAYMAPEQYQGRGIAPTTDVWALGLLAFNMLTGRNYWRNAVGTTSGPASLMYEACMEDLVSATKRARELGVDRFLPKGFDAWFSRCVAREPRDRYPGAWEALAAMKAVGSGVAPTLPQTLPVAPMVATHVMHEPVPPTERGGALVPQYVPESHRPTTRPSGLGRWLAIGGVVIVVLAGIGIALARSSGDTSDLETPPAPTAPPRVTVKPEQTPPKPPPTEAPARTASERSALPTVADWNVVGEVTVTGSSALSCETKMIREWLRVSCRGPNSTRGTPTEVTVLKGAADVYTFAKGDTTSLVCPFVEGTALEALFSWTDRKEKLLLSWPRGTPMPASKGRFVPY